MHKLPMTVCTECGWEIMRADVWIEPICDDCAMNMAIKHDKEQGIIV